ncbi:MAG: ATP-binding protein [Polyangiales bacterium]
MRVNLFARVFAVVLLAGIVTLSVSTLAVLAVVQDDREAGLVDHAMIATEQRRDAIRQRLMLARAQLRASAFAIDGGRLLEVPRAVEGTVLAVLASRGGEEVFEASSTHEAMEVLRGAGSAADGALVIAGTQAILRVRAGGVRVVGLVPLEDLVAFASGWTAALVTEGGGTDLIQARRSDRSIRYVAPIEAGLRLEMDVPLGPARAAAFVTSQRVMAASALVIVPLFLMAWLFSRGVTSPIRALVRVVSQSTTLPITFPKLPNDEVGDLGAAIEGLSARLHRDARALTRSLELSRASAEDPDLYLAELATELGALEVPWRIEAPRSEFCPAEGGPSAPSDEPEYDADDSGVVRVTRDHVIALHDGARDFGFAVASGEVSEADVRVAELLTRTALSNLRAANLERQARVGEKLAMLSRLSASVAHEMNTPLAFVNANMLAVLEEELSEDVREMVGDAHQGVQRLIHIVRDLSAVSSGGRSTSQESVEVNGLLQDMARMAHARRPAGTVEVVGDERLQVGVDRGRFEQVVLNLMNNALDAAGPGGNVQVHARRQGREVIIDVIDDGPGIPLGAKDRLFEAFYTSKGEQGTGLGLYISRSLVEAHGGTLELVASSSDGSTFRLSLPAATPDSIPAARATPIDSPRPRLLVIDDDAAVVRSMKRWLRKRADVEGTTDPKEGFEWMTHREFDLVLCDMSMPHLNGQGFVEALREKQPELLRKLVIVTGSAQNVPQGVRVVGKPLDPKILDSLLEIPESRGAA